MFKMNFRKIKAAFIRALKSQHEPQEIALGVAIGAFIGVLPLYGLHTFLCLIAIVLIHRANKLAIFLGTNISLPPTVAIISWTAYDIGRFLLPHKHYPPLSWEYLKNFQISRVGDIYYPLFVGSLVLGMICALVLYVVTFFIADYFKKRRLSRM